MPFIGQATTSPHQWWKMDLSSVELMIDNDLIELLPLFASHFNVTIVPHCLISHLLITAAVEEEEEVGVLAALYKNTDF